MKKSFKSLAFVAILALAPVSNAADRSFGEIYTDCGLGGLVGQAVDGTAGDLLAVVTNVVWDLGTTASSSALTTPGSCKNKSALAANLINQGYNKIELELASGDGEYLNALASLRLDTQESEAQFISSLRDNFSATVATNEYNTMTHYQKAETLYNSIYK